MISIKQNITKQDLLQLNDNQIKALFTYWWKTPPVKKNLNTSYARCEYDTGYLLDLPLMSIGDMIEFLETTLPLSQFIEDSIDIECDRVVKKYFVEFRSYENNRKFIEFDADSLCDCLWKAVRYVLNK